MYNEFNDFNYGNSAILFCMKKDNIKCHDNAFLYGPHIENGNLRIGFYEEMIYDGHEPKVLCTPEDRLLYLYASLHNDELIDSVVKEVFPEIYGDIIISSVRCTDKYYLKHWMKEYNISIKDFWLNNKYIVCIDDKYNHFADSLTELGIIKWENVEYCSEYELEDKKKGEE